MSDNQFAEPVFLLLHGVTSSRQAASGNSARLEFQVGAREDELAFEVALIARESGSGDRRRRPCSELESARREECVADVEVRH